MKSYTDIEQSKKLSKILPPESADMFWLVLGNISRAYVLIEPPTKCSLWKNYPCWSLAALLDVLPRETRLLKSTNNIFYHIDCPKCNIDKWISNPVDACYEIILKLHELKML